MVSLELLEYFFIGIVGALIGLAITASGPR
jgi:hypothetical protein